MSTYRLYVSCVSYVKPPWSGAAWKDVDANFCDTRNDVLNRGLADKIWNDVKKCVVATGAPGPVPRAGLGHVSSPWNTQTQNSVMYDEVVSRGPLECDK